MFFSALHKTLSGYHCLMEEGSPRTAQYKIYRIIQGVS